MTYKVHYTPEMQMAYLNAVSKARGQGYVNPERSAQKQIQPLINRQLQMQQRLNQEGRYRERLKQQADRENIHRDKEYGLNRQRLDMYRDQVKDTSQGAQIANLINVGRLGVGYQNYLKEQKFVKQLSKDRQAKLATMLQYYKENNPQLYNYYLNYLKNWKLGDQNGFVQPPTN